MLAKTSGVMLSMAGRTWPLCRYVAVTTTRSTFGTHLTTAAERERTFVMIKPDGVQRGLVGPIVSKIEGKGFKLCAMKLIHAPRAICENHYVSHKEKKFFPILMKYIQSGPVLPMIFEGKRAVESLRGLVGDKDPVLAAPGTIRGDWGVTVARNVIHASDSVESAEREIEIWFKPDEIVDWTSCHEPWLYEYDEK